MTGQHYARRELARLEEKAERLTLYALVDGIQFERCFDKSLLEGHGAHPLFSAPEDQGLAFAGPWLLDMSQQSPAHADDILRLEKKYPAVSWIISGQPLVTLARHLERGLMVTLPSKEQGVFRFYDCRVLKRLPDLLSPAQFAQLMKYSQCWFFLSDGQIIRYQKGRAGIQIACLGSHTQNRGEL